MLMISTGNCLASDSAAAVLPLAVGPMMARAGSACEKSGKVCVMRL